MLSHMSITTNRSGYLFIYLFIYFILVPLIGTIYVEQYHETKS